MSIYMRPNSQFYQIDFRLAGIRYAFSSETAKKAEALRIERRAKAEARVRGPGAGGRRDCTFDEAAYLYWDLQASAGRNPDIQKGWIRRVVLMVGAGTMCSSIDLQKMLGYRRDLRNGLPAVRAMRGGPKSHEEGKFAANTVNKYLGLVLRIVRHAENVLRTRFPDLPRPTDAGAEDERIMEIVRPRGRYLRAEEELRLEAVSDPDLLDMWKFDLETGLRESNLCQLRWDQVDISERTVTVNIKAEGGDPLLHSVDLSDAALAIIERRRGIHPEFVFTLPCRITCWMDGKMRKNGEHIPVIRILFYKRMKEAWTMAKIENLIVHDFRRTAARRMWLAKDIYAAQMLLGHSNLQTTANYIGLRGAEIHRALRNRAA